MSSQSQVYFFNENLHFWLRKLKIIKLEYDLDNDLGHGLIHYRRHDLKLNFFVQSVFSEITGEWGIGDFLNTLYQKNIILIGGLQRTQYIFLVEVLIKRK